MLHNVKATVLTMAILCAAGCAKSDYRVGRQYGKKWTPIDDRRVADAPDAVPPKILPATYFAAAQLFETQGALDRAILQYRRTIGAKHDHVDARHRLGRLLGRIGRHEEAITMLNSAVELAPDNASLHNDLGFELVYVKQWNKAEYAFRNAIRLRPGFPRAYINLGMTLCRLERHDEALESFQAVLSEADAYYNLGLMYRGQARYTDALAAFRTASTLDPGLTAARKHVAMLTEETSRNAAPNEMVPARKEVNDEAAVVVLGPTPTAAVTPDVAEADKPAVAAFPIDTRSENETAPASMAKVDTPAPAPDLKQRNSDTVLTTDAEDVASSEDWEAKLRDWENEFSNPREDDEPFVAIAEVDGPREFVRPEAPPTVTPTPATDFTAKIDSTGDSSAVHVAKAPIDSVTPPVGLRDDWPSTKDDPFVEEFLRVDIDAFAMVVGPPQEAEEFFEDETQQAEAATQGENAYENAPPAITTAETPDRTPTRTKREFFLTPRQSTHQKRTFTVATVKPPARSAAPQSRSSVFPSEEQDTQERPVFACTVEPVMEPLLMCPAEALCYVDSAVPSTAVVNTDLVDVFMESYSVPVSFVGQGKDPAMMTDRRIRMRELTERLADIRGEIECLTDREDDREAIVRARILGIDLSPTPLRRPAMAAADRKESMPVTPTRKSAAGSNVVAVGPRETMAMTIGSPRDTTKTAVVGPVREEITGSEHRIDRYSVRPIRRFGLRATLRQLAEQLNHVREEISCLEDVVIEEQLFRIPPSFPVVNEINAGNDPFAWDPRRSDAWVDELIEPRPQEFVPGDTVHHPLIAWLASMNTAAASDFPTAMTKDVSTRVRAENSTVVPADPSSTARLTLKALDRVIRGSRPEKQSMIGKTSVETVAEPAPVVKSAVELRWLGGLLDALQTEASCRSDSSTPNSDRQAAAKRRVNGELPPEIPFDTLLDIVKMQGNETAGDDSVMPTPTSRAAGQPRFAPAPK